MALLGTLKLAGDTLRYTPSIAVAAGQVVRVGSFCGVAPRAIAAATEGELSLAGEYELPAAAVNIAQGDEAFWDVSADAVTNVGIGNIRIGRFTRAMTSGAGYARVRLEQSLNERFANRTIVPIDLTSASHTVTDAQFGTILDVTGSGTYVVTLPAVSVGVDVIIRAASAAADITVSPNASDAIFGNGRAAATHDDKDLILASATLNIGDYVHLRGTTAGWVLEDADATITYEA